MMVRHVIFLVLNLQRVSECYMQVDSLSMFGVCAGGGAEPVEPAVEDGFVPGLEVEVLPA